MRVRRPLSIAVGSAAMAAAVAGSTSAAAGGAAAVAATATVAISPAAVHVRDATAAPPTTAYCETHFKIACYEPAQVQQAYNLGPLFSKGITGKGQTIVIVDSYGSPTVAPRPGRVRQEVRPAQPAVAEGDPAGRPGGQVPADLQPGGLGRRDRAGRRVVARDGPGREHRPGGDADLGERGHDRVPGDRQGRDVRGRPPPRRRDQPELQRDRADLPVQEVAAQPARRLPGRGEERRDRAGRLRGQRRGRRQVQREHLLPAPGDLVAGQRPAGDRGRRHPAAPVGQGRVALRGVERHLQRAHAAVHLRRQGPEPAGGRRREVRDLLPARVPERRGGRGRRPRVACRTSR